MKLVWVKGLRAPVPEIWPDDPIDAVTKHAAILDEHQVEERHTKLPLDVLQMIYPLRQKVTA